MEQEEIIDNTDKDFAHNWVSSSRFLFYCQLVLVFALLTGGCYGLYQHRYKGKPEVAVPANTLYNPQYK
ncbi:MAG: hypothetical protein H0W12_09485 [Chitinophagaceae bacterium]|nr:hypothetical protein [Chitinophagaceae bacterium]